MREIEVYSEKWKLSEFIFVEYYSFHAIFYCKSELYGNCVLKIYSDDFEYNTLCEYNGIRFIKVFERDNNVMLIERLIPGIMLKNEPSLEKRATVFSALFNGLHIEPKNPEIYQSYEKWICHRVDYMKTREDCAELYEHMQKAKEIYLEVSTVYNKKLLLHGDLHNDNILLNSDGKYKIIDPIGVIGDPIFEVGRYISKEYWDAVSENHLEIVNKVSDLLEKNLNIPQKISKQCFFIDIAILNCYKVDGGTPNMNDVRFAENVARGK